MIIAATRAALEFLPGSVALCGSTTQYDLAFRRKGNMPKLRDKGNIVTKTDLQLLEGFVHLRSPDHRLWRRDRYSRC